MQIHNTIGKENAFNTRCALFPPHVNLHHKSSSGVTTQIDLGTSRNLRCKVTFHSNATRSIDDFMSLFVCRRLVHKRAVCGQVLDKKVLRQPGTSRGWAAAPTYICTTVCSPAQLGGRLSTNDQLLPRPNRSSSTCRADSKQTNSESIQWLMEQMNPIKGSSIFTIFICRHMLIIRGILSLPCFHYISLTVGPASTPWIDWWLLLLLAGTIGRVVQCALLIADCRSSGKCT